LSSVLQVPVPEPGQLVDARRRRYVVVDIAQSPLPGGILTLGSNSQRQHLITLSSVEDDALGEELQVIWEIEPGAATLTKHENALVEAQRHTSVTRRPSVGILKSMVEMLDEENDNENDNDNDKNKSTVDATAAALEAVAPLFREPTAEEQALLQQMRTWAERASHRPDSKAQRDIRSILTELQESIRKELSQPAVVQLQFTGFSQDERQQYERDLDALEERAHQIDDEIRQEVERIQQRFADPQPRLFPVAVTYLVPERLAH
jgi:hypothetical protein